MEKFFLVNISIIHFLFQFSIYISSLNCFFLSLCSSCLSKVQINLYIVSLVSSIEQTHTLFPFSETKQPIFAYYSPYFFSFLLMSSANKFVKSCFASKLITVFFHCIHLINTVTLSLFNNIFNFNWKTNINLF
jgi:hypothetical protein